MPRGRAREATGAWRRAAPPAPRRAVPVRWARRWMLATATALTLLQGCATRPGADADPPWTSGRMALRAQASAGQPARSLTAEFDLRGDSRQGELRLSSALGARLASARWSAHEAWLDLGQGEQRYADLESLSRQALGEDLPLRALPDWLAGRPWPGAPVQAQAGGFEQLGWRIGLEGLAQGRIDAVRLLDPRLELRVRLARAE